MKTKKLEISNEKFDINLKFYFFLKHLVKSKLTPNQISDTLEIYNTRRKSHWCWNDTITKIEGQIEKFSGQQKKNDYSTVIELIQNYQDLKLFIFSLKLYSIKDMLLEEAKFKKAIIGERLAKLHPLSLEYDKLSVLNPYSTRVNGALLALLFFEKLETGQSDFMSADAEQFLKSLSSDAIELKKEGVEPNQIFMLMFNESINQSIISDSGTNYEDRILGVLVDELGINENAISKTHDQEDASTEYDFFFRLDDGRSYGIGAKRTLRERYKQFIKTAHTGEIDVMIEITIGLDLNRAKAETIRTHGIYIFVANEIYDNRDDLQHLDGVFPIRELTIQTFLNL